MKRTERLANRHMPVVLLALMLSLGAFLFASDPVAGGRLESAGDDEVRLTAVDDGRRVSLDGDQILSITLDGNPSTGYTWVVDGVEQEFVRQVGEVEFSPQSDKIGAPGKLTLHFQMVRAGSTTLRLAYRRPWEDRPPERTFSVELEGTGDLAPLDDRDDLETTPAPPPLTPQDLAPSDRVPSYFNWCDQGACTPVKNQSSCGSCWAFATAGVFESSLRIHDGVTRDLAEQYLVSCNTEDPKWGCDGGGRAFDYYLDRVPSGEPDAGAVYESDFPYTAADDPCNPPHPHYEKIVSWDWEYGAQPVADIQQMIYDHGPVYVSVCAGDAFQAYDGGVFETEESSFCGGGTNHAVILVGWDDSQGTSGVWYLKNSWSTGWGESGYMRIGYGVSNVGRSPAYVVYGDQGDVGPLVYDGHTVDDDANGESVGDDDGVIDCGETVELYVDLLNQGGSTATGLNATLSTTDPYVSTFLFNTDSGYSDIVGSGIGTNSNDWDFTVDAATPDGHLIDFDIDVTGSNGGPWADSFSIPVACAADQAEWTFMVYLDADNNLEDAGIDDFFELSSVGSTSDVNIVVQFDRISGYDTGYDDWTDTRRFLIAPGLAPLAANGTSIGEANMGDPQTLVDFVQWGVANYPANRYAVIIWDHGSGWLRSDQEPVIKSIASDSTDGDALTMPELRSAMSTLSSGGSDPLDLVGLDACLMAMAEVDNQMIPYVDVRVGSEETEPWDGWPYDAILSALTANPTMSAAQLGTEIVDDYYASYGSSQTQSAVDLGSAYATLDTAVDNFAAALIAGVDAHYADIATARGSAQEFYYPTFIDLYDFAYQVSQNVSDATIDSAATAVMNAVDGAVIHEQHGTSWPGAHGISIYFPELESSYSSRYDGSQGFLQFTANTRWDEWLHTFYAGGSCGDPHEVNDTPGQATLIAYGDTVTDPDICPVGDWDYYAFTASASDVITVDIDARSIGSILDPYLYLYDTDGVTELAHNDDYDGLDSYLEYTLPANGTYYLAVREFSDGYEGGANYFYTLSLTGFSPPPGPLVFDSYIVDDDDTPNSIGNGDGIPNPGETIELYVVLRNEGLGAATGVTATLSTSDAYISDFLFNTGSDYDDVLGGGTAVNSYDWEFTISPSTPDGHQVTFCLDPILDGEARQWADCFELTVANTRSVYVPLVIREE